MTKILLIASSVIVLALASVSKAQTSDFAAPKNDGMPPVIVPSRTEVERAIQRSTDYLVRACGPDGKFAYFVDTSSGRESADYNIIRHAGAIYALSMANHAHSDPKVVAAMVRAAYYLRKNYVGPGLRPDQLTVWSRPLGHEPPAKDNYAELGGTALGLVALAAVREVDQKAILLEDLQALGRFLLYSQREDGSFNQKYGADGTALQDWTVLYYPGEASLGLIMLFEADHSVQWLTAAGKALSFLAKSRKGVIAVPADHWALIASAALMPYLDQIHSVGTRAELTQHAGQVCNVIMHEQFRGGSASGLDGAFDPGGRTTPAATRLEGLLAALEFLPNADVRHKVEEATARGIAFLLRAQITDGSFAGAITGSVRTSAFDSAAVRIDFIQHALCAWLRYKNLAPD